MIIYLLGMPGSGKTTLGKGLASHYGYEFLDMDQIIVEKAGKSINQIFSEDGEVAFRLLEQEVLKEVSKKEASLVIATGGGAPCFFDNIDVIKKTGKSIFIDVSAKELLRRMQMGNNQANRPMFADKNLTQVEEELSLKINTRREFYEQADHLAKGDQLSWEDLIF